MPHFSNQCVQVQTMSSRFIRACSPGLQVEGLSLEARPPFRGSLLPRGFGGQGDMRWRCHFCPRFRFRVSIKGRLRGLSDVWNQLCRGLY